MPIFTINNGTFATQISAWRTRAVNSIIETCWRQDQIVFALMLLKTRDKILII